MMVTDAGGAGQRSGGFALKDDRLEAYPTLDAHSYLFSVRLHDCT